VVDREGLALRSAYADAPALLALILFFSKEKPAFKPGCASLA
jgi:hypothetical protein